MIAPIPVVPLPDPTPDTPALPDRTTLPDKPENQERPIMPKPNIVDTVAARPLFKVRSWIFLLLTILSWLGGHFGIPGLDVVAWAGPDAVMTVGELLTGLFATVAAWFTANRKPGEIKGLFTVPKS